MTIPKRLRERLGIRAGERLVFEEAGPGVLLARKSNPRDRVDAAYGVLDLADSTDELIESLRGKPDAT